MTKGCDSCGKPSSHTLCFDGFAKHLCCECYVKSGNAPADWHPICMQTYEAMMAKTYVKPGQSVREAIDNATRAHGPSSMSFELGLDHIVLNGHRIVRPSGVSRSSWDKFWSRASWHIVDLH